MEISQKKTGKLETFISSRTALILPYLYIVLISRLLAQFFCHKEGRGFNFITNFPSRKSWDHEVKTTFMTRHYSTAGRRGRRWASCAQSLSWWSKWVEYHYINQHAVYKQSRKTTEPHFTSISGSEVKYIAQKSIAIVIKVGNLEKLPSHW